MVELAHVYVHSAYLFFLAVLKLRLLTQYILFTSICSLFFILKLRFLMQYIPITSIHYIIFKAVENEIFNTDSIFYQTIFEINMYTLLLLF